MQCPADVAKGGNAVNRPQSEIDQWVSRIEAADSARELSETVREAVRALSPSDIASDIQCAKVAERILGGMIRKPGLDEKKRHVAAALEPLVAARRAVARNVEADGGTASEVWRAARARGDSAGLGPMPAVALPPEAPTAGFDASFSVQFTRYIAERLAPLKVDTLGSRPLPFFLSPKFHADFTSVVSSMIVPAMLATRRIDVLRQGFGGREITETEFQDIVRRPERENIARTLWFSQWASIKVSLEAFRPATFGSERAAGATRKGDPERIWSFLQERAFASNYDPPLVADITVFQALFDFVPRLMEEATVGVQQSLYQEAPGRGGRDGAACQFMCKMVAEMPIHSGELVALWAFFACERDFSRTILRQFIASHGRTKNERYMHLPIFLRWTPDILDSDA